MFPTAFLRVLCRAPKLHSSDRFQQYSYTGQNKTVCNFVEFYLHLQINSEPNFKVHNPQTSCLRSTGQNKTVSEFWEGGGSRTEIMGVSILQVFIKYFYCSHLQCVIEKVWRLEMNRQSSTDQYIPVQSQSTVKGSLQKG